MDVCEISKPQLILTACLDGKIRLFNLYEKEYLKIWTNSTESGVKHLIFNPNVDQNGLILASGFEYYISLFGTDLSLDDAYKGKLEGHNSPVVSMIVLGKSYMCASVDSDGCSYNRSTGFCFNDRGMDREQGQMFFPDSR